MDISQLAIDLIRTVHLLSFAAGMGIAVFFDWRTFQSLNVPISSEDLEVLHEIHSWITMAFGGLWMTGVMLVYIRTGFEISNFTPKLFTKLAVMTAMVLNARAIAAYVLPTMANNTGRCVLELPYAKLVGLSQCAINSICFWIIGLILGSSVVLKTAGWDVLVPLIAGSFVVLTVGGQTVMLGLLMRRKMTRPAFAENA